MTHNYDTSITSCPAILLIRVKISCQSMLSSLDVYTTTRSQWFPNACPSDGPLMLDNYFLRKILDIYDKDRRWSYSYYHYLTLHSPLLLKLTQALVYNLFQETALENVCPSSKMHIRKLLETSLQWLLHAFCQHLHQTGEKCYRVIP